MYNTHIQRLLLDLGWLAAAVAVWRPHERHEHMQHELLLWNGCCKSSQVKCLLPCCAQLRIAFWFPAIFFVLHNGIDVKRAKSAQFVARAHLLMLTRLWSMSSASPVPCTPMCTSEPNARSTLWPLIASRSWAGRCCIPWLAVSHSFLFAFLALGRATREGTTPACSKAGELTHNESGSMSKRFKSI